MPPEPEPAFMSLKAGSGGGAHVGQVHNQAEDQQKIYQRWAPVYDRLYRGLLRDGHRTLAQLAANRQAAAVALIQALGGGWHIETP